MGTKILSKFKCKGTKFIKIFGIILSIMTSSGRGEGYLIRWHYDWGEGWLKWLKKMTSFYVQPQNNFYCSAIMLSFCGCLSVGWLDSKQANWLWSWCGMFSIWVIWCIRYQICKKNTICYRSPSMNHSAHNMDFKMGRSARVNILLKQYTVILQTILQKYLS